MTFPIYEFSKAFRETVKDIEWVSKEYPEALRFPELRQKIELQGLWLSGGFLGGHYINRSNFLHIDKFPPEIIRAVEDELFKIPNEYRPEPGATTLLEQGKIIEQPPLKSIALIARKIGNYCVLAVATGQLDSKGRDRFVGYRYFWLDVQTLDLGDSQKTPDGILTLLQWWFNNGQPCFNMNPDLFKAKSWEVPKKEICERPKSLNAEDHKSRPDLLKLLLKTQDKNEFPPFIIETNQPQINVDFNFSQINVDFNFSQSILSAIRNIHLLALATNEIFIDCPIAWAWNVQRVTKPEEFAVILCADHEALAHYNKLKSNLHTKARNQQLDIQKDLDYFHCKRIKLHLNKISRNPHNINFFREFLQFYFDNYNSKIEEACWILVQEKASKYRSITQIKYMQEALFVYLLFILGVREDNSLNLENLLQNYEKLEQRGWNITGFLTMLLKHIEVLKKDGNFIQEYSEYQQKYEDIEQRILILLSRQKPLPTKIRQNNNTIPQSSEGNFITRFIKEIFSVDTLPIEIADKNSQANAEYARQLDKEEKEYIYEAKLLIIGEAGAGKTTLAKKIQNPKYKLQVNQKSTEGIDIIKWSFYLNNGQEFKVNIWDFGGQEIYHNTHKFFLTKRSLYVLVADNRKEDTNFYYWLNTVGILSENSPLLIIKNEQQNRKRQIDEQALRKSFTNLKETLATNLVTNQGLEKITNSIRYHIQNLPHIGKTLPKTWVIVRQALENDSRNYISLQEYRDICEANGLKNRENQLQLSAYLHDLGICLHFQDKEDSVLYKTVILKPKWGIDAAYKILDNKQVIDNKGRFTRKDLKNIWQDENYYSMRGELLELMKKFKLCYEIPDIKDTLIAPQLLSDNQPEYDWDKPNNLILRYAYPDFMPKGIISCFIVVMYKYIDQQNVVWKTGVILNKENTKAEVIEDYGNRTIRIRVAGTDKRGLMTIVTHELDKINNSYDKLNYQKLIPCNCEVCKNSQNPHAYKFNKLLERIANNQLTIQCENPPYHEVQVLSLIDNTIDLKQFIYQYQQDKNKSIDVEGDIKELVFQIIEKGDYIDRRRSTSISGDAKVNVSGAGAFSSGDINDTIANNINQLSSFDNELNKK